MKSGGVLLLFAVLVVEVEATPPRQPHSVLVEEFFSYSDTASSSSSSSPEHAAAPGHPDARRFQFDLPGFGTVRLHLNKNHGLFSSGYVAHRPQGKRQLKASEHCFYHGFAEVLNQPFDANNIVAISTCSGLEGFVVVGKDMFWIQPELQTGADFGQKKFAHRHLIQLKQLNGAAARSCSVGAVRLGQLKHHHHHHPLSQLRGFHSHTHSHNKPIFDVHNTAGGAPASLRQGRRQLKQQLGSGGLVVEMLVVNDRSMYSAERGNVELRTSKIVNLASALFGNGTFSQPVSLRLVAQATWTKGDPYEITAGCSTCEAGEVDEENVLRKFSEWVRGPSAPSVQYDAAHLFTRFDFAGQAVGYANLGTMCSSQRSTGVNSLFQAEDDMDVALTLAHEVGHNLGMEHDEDIGCADGFIMAASNLCNSSSSSSSSSSSPAGGQPGGGGEAACRGRRGRWSSCSVHTVDSFAAMSTSTSSCLKKLDERLTWQDRACGNGFVEPWEQCDCGDTSDCASVDPCCNAATCTLLPSAQCSAKDICCTPQCKFVPFSAQVVCRGAKASAHGCDVAEVCDGKQGVCPSDQAASPGTQCSVRAAPGWCYAGVCHTLGTHCEGVTDLIGGPFVECPFEWVQHFNSHDFCSKVRCRQGEGGEIQTTGTHNPPPSPSFPSNALPPSSTATMSCLSYSGQEVPFQDGSPCAYLHSPKVQPKQCYRGKCVLSSSMANPGSDPYAWARVSDWSACFSCTQAQTRTATCFNMRTRDPAPAKLCPPFYGRRLCQNETLGCEAVSQFSDPQCRLANNLRCVLLLGYKVPTKCLYIYGPLLLALLCAVFLVWCLCKHCRQTNQADASSGGRRETGGGGKARRQPPRQIQPGVAAAAGRNNIQFAAVRTQPPPPVDKVQLSRH